MARIQSTIGLITGVPIADTVEQLLAVSARPRDQLLERSAGFQAQQVAVTELTGAVLGVQFAANGLAKEDVFNTTKVSSSNNALLTATQTGSPAIGNYQFTAVQKAQSQQLLSSGFAALDEPIGEGSLSLRYGGAIDEGISLDDLNGGQGLQRGKIRITDRSGSSAEVDLRFVRTVDDVIEAINSTSGIDVTASAEGDTFRIDDNTGLATSNLKIVEVGSGSTAADLGFAGVDVAADSVTGSDVLFLHDDTALSLLNDGNGVSFRDLLPDLEITFRDNSSALQIDFSAGGDPPNTLGELLTAINAADPARLQAEISASGDSIQLTDLTTDSGGTFAVASPLGGSVAEDLGLTGSAAAGVIESRRLQSGLKTSLLSSLGGGSGLGQLGVLSLTDRSGASANVDLSAAETLQDVVDSINAAGVGIVADINQGRNGLLLTDTTGSTANNLQIANGDATNTADLLGVALDDAVKSIDGTALQLQVVSEQTRLEELNGGRGVELGSLIIIDTNGVGASLDLREGDGVETIGQLIDAVNGLSNNVQARINDAGDGIVIIDQAGGTETLKILPVGSQSTAADLHLLGGFEEVDIGGQLTQVIDGSTTLTLDISAEDTLQDVIDNLNGLGAPLSASTFTDGSGSTPHRISLVSQLSGKDGELFIDTSQAGFNFEEIVAAQDALLLFGSAESESAGVLTSSSDNTFDGLLEGVSLTVNGASTNPVEISVTSTDSSLVSGIETFVNLYNGLRDKLDDLTFFNETDNKTGLLFGSSEALRVDTEISGLISGRFFGLGEIQSLESLGISLNDTGRLTFDSVKFRSKNTEDPASVEKFFADEEIGFVAKIDKLIEQLAGEGNSLLVNRATALGQKIDLNFERILTLNARLETERERLLTQFYNMELAIGKLQNNLTAINSIQPIAPLGGSQ